ncbi:hypothetical protein INR49_016043 [Caranx melampygus]|nr:hypothetical protein INR49_016043 [Caranx melampygus]
MEYRSCSQSLLTSPVHTPEKRPMPGCVVIFWPEQQGRPLHTTSLCDLVPSVRGWAALIESARLPKFRFWGKVHVTIKESGTLPETEDYYYYSQSSLRTSGAIQPSVPGTPDLLLKLWRPAASFLHKPKSEIMARTRPWALGMDTRMLWGFKASAGHLKVVAVWDQSQAHICRGKGLLPLEQLQPLLHLSLKLLVLQLLLLVNTLQQERTPRLSSKTINCDFLALLPFVGNQRSKGKPKCTTPGPGCSVSSPYFVVSNRDRQSVRSAVGYIENAICLTGCRYEIFYRRCNVNGIDPAAVVDTALYFVIYTGLVIKSDWCSVLEMVHVHTWTKGRWTCRRGHNFVTVLGRQRAAVNQKIHADAVVKRRWLTPRLQAEWTTLAQYFSPRKSQNILPRKALTQASGSMVSSELLRNCRRHIQQSHRRRRMRSLCDETVRAPPCFPGCCSCCQPPGLHQIACCYCGCGRAGRLKVLCGCVVGGREEGRGERDKKSQGRRMLLSLGLGHEVLLLGQLNANRCPIFPLPLLMPDEERRGEDSQRTSKASMNPAAIPCTTAHTLGGTGRTKYQYTNCVKKTRPVTGTVSTSSSTFSSSSVSSSLHTPVLPV